MEFYSSHAACGVAVADSYQVAAAALAADQVRCLGVRSGGLPAAANGGNSRSRLAATGAGATLGVVSGVTFGAVPAAAATTTVITFSQAATTGAASSAIGEAAGQIVSGTTFDPDRVGAAAMVGGVSGMGGFLARQMALGARTSILVGGTTEFLLSPTVANAQLPAQSCR